MQCSQPFCGTTGFLYNYGLTHPCNFAFPQPEQQPYPQIIGEGEVASVAYPDGSVHLYFIPLNKRFPPYNCHPNQSPTSFCNNNMGAYYVRSISNPITPAIFSQQCQKVYPGPYSMPCLNSNPHLPSPGFQLKFHNDCWTSTTDLQYFFPRLRQCDWFPSTLPRGCASVQVDIPVKQCANIQQERLCTKPCLCTPAEYGSDCESTDEDLGSNKKQASKKNNKSKNSKHKQKKLEKKKSKVECHCREKRTNDKSITTVADQSMNCTAGSEQNTQTHPKVCAAATSYTGSCNYGCRKDRKIAELWLPKTSLSGMELPEKSLSCLDSCKEMDTKSSHKLIVIGSSDTCCCSETE